jgi:hypothetical protein
MPHAVLRIAYVSQFSPSIFFKIHIGFGLWDDSRFRHAQSRRLERLHIGMAVDGVPAQVSHDSSSSSSSSKHHEPAFGESVRGDRRGLYSAQPESKDEFGEVVVVSIPVTGEYSAHLCDCDCDSVF